MRAQLVLVLVLVVHRLPFFQVDDGKPEVTPQPQPKPKF
jgi:hypothetical protein